LRYDKFIRDWKTAVAENFFLKVLMLFISIALILSLSVFRVKERIVVSPPEISRKFWVEANRASPAYLEQMGVFFATLAGNLSPANAGYNVDALLPYIPTSTFGGMKAELGAQAAYIVRNNITQAFFPSAVQVNPDESRVVVEGTAVRNIGTVKISSEKMIYRIKLRIEHFQPYLDEFYIDYPERSKEAFKQAEEKKAEAEKEKAVATEEKERKSLPKEE